MPQRREVPRPVEPPGRRQEQPEPGHDRDPSDESDNLEDEVKKHRDIEKRTEDDIE